MINVVDLDMERTLRDQKIQAAFDDACARVVDQLLEDAFRNGLGPEARQRWLNIMKQFEVWL
jgi:hypothetical protein